MSFDDKIISASKVSKNYLIYDKPELRLKQMVAPRLRRMLGLSPRNYYRQFSALKDVSFGVRRGETVGIVGRNGSGKSTLLQIICGTLTPSSGAVRVDGRIAALLELGAGFNPEFTGRENVYLYGAILGLKRADIEERFDAIAAFADIGAFIDQPVKTYSSGMYVRLAFATATSVDPDILVVDEALAVGDESFKRKCYARIEQIKERGGTILFVSHASETIINICSHAILLDGGELIMQGEPKTVINQYRRLLNASPAALPSLRMEIKDHSSQRIEPPKQESRALLPDAKRDTLRASQVEMDASHFDYFNPGLKSQSSVESGSGGARISNAGVFTLPGKPVNVIRMGSRYAIKYSADFDVAATNVSFGVQIKGVTGLNLAGAHTRLDSVRKIARVESGERVNIVFEFDARLLPRMHFVSCSVWGDTGSGAASMHKLGDCIAFQIAPEQNLIATGLADLSFQHAWSIENQQANASPLNG